MGRGTKHPELCMYIDGIIDGALDEMLALFEEPSAPWRPEQATWYWTVEGDGHIYEAFWQDDDLDKARADFGSCFKTRAHAHQACQKIKAVLAHLHHEYGP